jgi:NitT/TauT family transport system ATP-binding protein
MIHLSTSSLGKQYTVRTPKGPQTVDILHDVNLSIQQNEFVSIVGSSGSGKTTLLRIVAGLTKADQGKVEIGGREVSDPGPDRAMVFQSINLFPWRTVLANVEFGLELRGFSEKERRERAISHIELVGLGKHLHSYPHELSGGMQQRVGIARALATDPEILLMDEPFGSLDAQTAEFLWEELSRIVAATKKTVLFVTHHIDEAIYLSDRIVVLGGSPAGIREIITVDFPKPRWTYDVRADPKFAQLRARLREQIFQSTTKADATDQ